MFNEEHLCLTYILSLGEEFPPRVETPSSLKACILLQFKAWCSNLSVHQKGQCLLAMTQLARFHHHSYWFSRCDAGRAQEFAVFQVTRTWLVQGPHLENYQFKKMHILLVSAYPRCSNCEVDSLIRHMGGPKRSSKTFTQKLWDSQNYSINVKEHWLSYVPWRERHSSSNSIKTTWPGKSSQTLLPGQGPSQTHSTLCWAFMVMATTVITQLLAKVFA